MTSPKKQESARHDSKVDPLSAHGDPDDMGRFKRHYDTVYAEPHTTIPADESVAGLHLLLSQRLEWVLGDLQPSPRELLEVGCGDGKWLSTWAKWFSGCRISGCDISSVAVERARQRCPSARLEVNTQDALPFPSEHFDMVMSVEVLEHVPDRDLFVSELFRVLKPNGLCLITVPCANPCSLQWFQAHLKRGGRIRTPYGIRWYMEIPEHLHRLTSREVKQLFSRQGFSIVRYYFWAQCFARLDIAYGTYIRQPGTRYHRIRKRLRFLATIFDVLSRLEWTLCKHWPNGAHTIAVFRKPHHSTSSP